ncbi:MAG TPA: hypothetical protein VJ650_02310 [Gemmatimonadaceae bacterium]|nr:hypothetical protein [Gemmatimonadaceae bacterium]
MAFGNVCRDGHRRTANLDSEAESLICWQSTPDFVRLDHKPNAELPDMQISITTNHEGSEE